MRGGDTMPFLWRLLGADGLYALQQLSLRHAASRQYAAATAMPSTSFVWLLHESAMMALREAA